MGTSGHRRIAVRATSTALALLALAALVMALLALAGCGKKPSATRTVVFWQFSPLPAIQPIVARFEAENPGVTVQVEQLTWQSGREKIVTAIAAGRPPDLCELGSTFLPGLVADSTLLDLTDRAAKLRDRLVGWDITTYRGRVYAYPWMVGTRALYLNDDLFRRAGLDPAKPPETWDDLLRAARAISERVPDAKGFGMNAGEREVLFKKFMPFAWGNGGRILSDDLARSEFDSPRNVEALAFYAGLRSAGMIERQDMLDRAFKEGRLGLQISGAWLFRSIPKEAPGLRYGVALVPRPERARGFHASFAGGEVLVSFTAAKEQEGALALARFLARPENALALAAAAQSVQPASVGADTAAYYRERPMEQLMIRQFETAVPTPNHPAWVDLEAAIEDEVEQVLYDRKTPAQAVADAHRRIAERLTKP